MKLLTWEEFVFAPPLKVPLAATIGVFDGLHIGHRRLIAKVLEAKAGGFGARGEGRAAAFTFRENPKKLLRPALHHGDLATLEQKLETFEELGLDLVVLIDFSGNFSKLAGRDFLSLLWDRGGLAFAAVGSNFRCGHRLDTDAEALAGFFAERGVMAEVLEPVEWGGHPVSSTRVRLAIREGRLEEAAALLGRPYELDLRRAGFLDGHGKGRVFLAPGDLVLPPAGTYEAFVGRGGSSRPVLLELSGERLSLRGEDLGRQPERVSLIRLYKETKR